MDPGQRFSKEVLEAVLPQTVLPAATSEGGDASVADLAAGVLAGAAARLAAGSAAPAAPRLALLLRLAGSYLSFAAQQSLEQGSLERAVGGEEAAKTLEQELGKQLGQPSSGVAFERVAALAGALAGAVGAQQVRGRAAGNAGPRRLWRAHCSIVRSHPDGPAAVAVC